MKKIFAVMITIIMVAACGCSSRGRSERIRSESSLAASSSSEETSQAGSGKLFVYVCGEVAAPGVYELLSGSRVKDAIDMAGGLSADADLAGINQALLVKDQDKIVVPSKKAAVSDTAGGSSGGLTDINRATKEELMKLPGIGESRALAIISYREKTGGFKSIEDILKVEGIKSGVFNKIKDSISVG